MPIAEKAELGSVILCMLPDTGSAISLLFEPFGAEMNDEELALSRSTHRIPVGLRITTAKSRFCRDAPGNRPLFVSYVS